MILQTRNLSLQRGGAPRLSFPDMTLYKGQALLLLGPSGSGKTTLLSLLAGLLPPSTGTVFLKDKNLYTLSSQNRDHTRGQNFGFIFQTLHLLPSLTVRKNILLASQMADKEVDQARADQLISSLGLSGKAEHKPHELSQGERQRVAIARAVFNRPAIILADEPTSALDDVNTAITMDIITSQAQETGAALVVATHDHRIKNRFQSIVTLDTQMTKAA